MSQPRDARTGVWGEALELQPAGSDRLRKVRSVAPVPLWQQFLDIRDHRVPNASPPEIGLRMARLWDAIRASAARGGAVITDPTTPPVEPFVVPPADVLPSVASRELLRGFEAVG